MTSSYSTDLKLELMVTGENAGTWGTKTNSNLNLLQQAIAGFQAVSIAGGAQTTALVMSNAEISTARNAVVKLTGTITGNQIVTIPDGIEKTYIVENGTTGVFTVQFKTVSGTGPTFSTTDKGIKIVYSDGTNVVDVNANLSGPTLASDLDVNGKSIISTSNGNIVLAPNGTGDVQLDADTVRIGDSNANATLTTNGTGDLILNTNSGSNSGSITIKDGTNGDIEITPNGSGVVKLDGLSYPTTDGSADQVLKTNGSGVISFGTISSSPTQLVSSIPLASGVSYTAGQLASINASGDIVGPPTLNTFGTTRTNSVATAYNAISDDGSTAVKWAETASTFNSSTITITGVAISNSANPTNGGTTVTNQISVRTGDGTMSSTVNIIPLNNNKFLFQQYGFTNTGGGNYCFDLDTYIVEVNTSTGNCTKGNIVGSSVETAGAAGFITYELSRITGDIIYRRIQTNGSSVNLTGIVTWTGTTITVTSDSDASGFSGANGKNTILTSNNILGFGTGASWKTATWTASPVGIGTVSTTTQISDYSSNGNWAKMIAFGTDAPEYVIATYQNTSAVNRYITYSVNQTTGALTQVEAGNLSAINDYNASMFVFKDKNSFVAVNSASSGSLSFTNGVKNTPASNRTYTLNDVYYNSGNLFYNFSTASSFPTNTGYTVNAYATNNFNYIGVAKTTDSTSPIDIVTDGVAGGFTSLTAGTLYYATTPADGTVTTSAASGLLIGKAISATEILLQRSNAQ
jgi:hypothetical protein